MSASVQLALVDDEAEITSLLGAYLERHGIRTSPSTPHDTPYHPAARGLFERT